MSLGARLFTMVLLICAAVGGLVGYLGHREDAAEQRGVDKQVAADIAKANQEIATRRETDAHFDSRDARKLCVDDFGLEWVFEDGKSFCR